MEASGQRTRGHEDHSDLAVTRQRIDAWGNELRQAHNVLRERLRQARIELEGDHRPERFDAELILHCVGFCDALTGHHEAENRSLFPLVLLEDPDFAGDVEKLIEDHRFLAGLLNDLSSILESGSRREVNIHLDGIEAIMESHFAFEERKLADVLDGMVIDNVTSELLGLDPGAGAQPRRCTDEGSGRYR